MGPTKLTLTSFQQRQLAPLFAQIRAGNARGEAGAIMAQILPDGMILKAVSGKALEALQAALGSDPNAPPQRSVKGH
jgi:hypothetical protein